tara:strand:+ start:564 stop:758 length:195 start_codon:yes stop_codon:yes gene_type:complete
MVCVIAVQTANGVLDLNNLPFSRNTFVFCEGAECGAGEWVIRLREGDAPQDQEPFINSPKKLTL